MAKVAIYRRDEGLDPNDLIAGRDRGLVVEVPLNNEALERAERIRASAAQLRERDIDPATCDQIDAVVATIFSAPALRDPTDPRVRQLADVLSHLERRIEAMLESATSAPPPTALPERAPAVSSSPVSPSVNVEPQAGTGAVVRNVLPVKSGRPTDDPLAALMALSDAERIALFS